MTTTTRPHHILAALLACLALAVMASASRAQEVGPSGPQMGCLPPIGDGPMHDGDVITYIDSRERRTYTCTNGEICVSWSHRKTGRWFYDCYDAPSGAPVVTTTRPTAPKTVTTATANLTTTRR
jgi:hypothetical protein